MQNPEHYIQAFVDAGADIITVHQEACPHLHRVVQQIKQAGVKAGVVINPATPVESIEYVLEDVDLVLVMTVNPGFGGQSFIPSGLNKIKQLFDLRSEHGYSYEIEVDGGVNQETAKQCIDAGADVLVAGSAIFNKDNRIEALKAIKESL